MLQRVARSDPSLFKPVSVVRLLDRPVPINVFRWLLISTIITNVLFLLGWRHRYTGPLFASLLLWIMCYRNSWSMIYHNDNVLVLHVVILGLTPAADVLSMDALPRSRQSASHDDEGDWRYGWPIKLMNTVTLLTYFLAGMAKVAGPLGWKWAGGEALRRQIAVDGLRKEVMGSQAAPLAYKLYNQVALFNLIGFGSLAIELIAPAMLADKRVSRVWALGAWLMHWGIFFIMNIRFRYQLNGLIFAPFFDVEQPLEWLKRLYR